MTHAIAPSATIALTGASGFIGTALCRQLLAQGYQVRALVRQPSKFTLSTAVNLTVIDGSLSDTLSLQHLVQSVDAVIHCAGCIRGYMASTFEQVNVDGLRQLLNVIRQQSPPPRLLYLSSLAASQPQLSYYAASKWHSEQLLQAVDDVSWAAIRPPVVYGPDDPALLPLFRWMSRGLAPIPCAIANRFSLIYVDDLVRAMMAWLTTASPISGVYSIHDGCCAGYNWRTIIDTVAQQQQKPVKTWVIPPVLLTGLACGNTVAGSLFGYAPLLTAGKLRELRYPNWVCDNTWGQYYAWQPKVALKMGVTKVMTSL